MSIRTREEEGKEDIGGGARKSETAEVDLAVQEPHVECVPAEPQGGRGLAGSTVCQPSHGSHRGSIDRQRGKANKQTPRLKRR